ncbi:MAG: S8 family serine peptidase [Oscillibacter sp.]|nr:S8 family serine peptidase [Oscillibacter sp.]
MAKRLLTLWVSICAAVLLIPCALAATPPEMQITDADFSNQSCTFHVHLSTAEEQSTVFVAVYDGQSGQMKRIESYEARENLSVTLDRIVENDRVKVMWTDGGFMPLALSEVSRASAQTILCDTYADYASALSDMLRDYSDKFSPDALAQGGQIDSEGMMTDDYAFARLIVRSDNGLPDLSDCNVARQVSDKDGHTVLQFDSAEDAKNCAARLRDYLPKDTPGNYVEPDMAVRVNPEEVESEDDIDASSLSWGVSAIHADQYAESLRNMNSKVTVAVVDTGVDSGHEFLKNRTVPGFDFVDNDSDPMDKHYHGTHVAGTIVDCTPGLTNLKIMPVRVLDANGSGSYLNVSLGVRYAADNDADVINMSLGGGHSSVMDEAVDYAVSKNVIVVVAAGNETDDAKNHCPAHIAKCITVSAVDSKFKPAYFTNYSQTIVDVAAPGVDIKSCIPGNKYKSLNGTSMASPHTAACVAMLRYENPNLTTDEAEKVLKNGVQVPSGWNTKYGPGVVDMRSHPEPAEFYAFIYSDGEMVFQNSSTPASGRTVLGGPYALSAVSAQYAGWYTLRDKITKVTFAEEVHPASTALWFYGCENLKTIQNPQNLKTDGVTNMSQMFSRCGSLETLDLKSFDTKNVTNMRQMFFQCPSLQTILASDSFSVAKVTDGRDMFKGCTSLRGDNGTVYSDSHTDQTHARLDGGSSSPGYLSSTSTPNPNPNPGKVTNPIYAVLYNNGELKFQSSASPESGRTAVKTYTTDSGGYDKNVEGYTAWYEEREQIKSVNFGIAIYPESTALWFYDCKNLSSISNPGNLRTDYVTDMSNMFAYCSSLTSLDLSGFNTGKTLNTATMFYDCGKLKTIYASGLFTTSQISDSFGMFDRCTALKGGNGTSYSSAHVDKAYARIDSGSSPGYFTAK